MQCRSLPVDYEVGGAPTEASAQTVTVSLNETETRALLQQVPVVYHTQINDILLTALALAFKQHTGGNRPLLIDLEGHPTAANRRRCGPLAHRSAGSPQYFQYG